MRGNYNEDLTGYLTSSQQGSPQRNRGGRPPGNDIIDTLVSQIFNKFDKDRNGPFTESSPYLTRWILDLKSGCAKSEQLEDRSIEFPRVRPDLVSKSNQFGYALASSNSKKPDFKEIVKYDFVNDSSEVYEYGSGNFGAEPVFVPSEGANDEDEGYLLSLVYDQETDKSDLIILNAQEVSSGPLAKVHLPQRVPFGFHGDWINI